MSARSDVRVMRDALGLVLACSRSSFDREAFDEIACGYSLDDGQRHLVRMLAAVALGEFPGAERDLHRLIRRELELRAAALDFAGMGR
jgi:hypothetical protein